jgi:hypothetical protein
MKRQYKNKIDQNKKEEESLRMYIEKMKKIKEKATKELKDLYSVSPIHK